MIYYLIAILDLFLSLLCKAFILLTYIIYCVFSYTKSVIWYLLSVGIVLLSLYLKLKGIDNIFSIIAQHVINILFCISLVFGFALFLLSATDTIHTIKRSLKKNKTSLNQEVR